MGKITKWSFGPDERGISFYGAMHYGLSLARSTQRRSVESLRMWRAEYPQVWFTFGHNTTEDATIRAIFQAGATGTRFTFSYGSPELQIARSHQVRAVADELGIVPFLVADLAGEKCRFAEVPGHQTFRVSKGDKVQLTTGEADPTALPLRLPVQIPRYLNELARNDCVVVGDGDLLFKVVDLQPGGVLCEVLGSGEIRIGRGILIQRRDFRPQPLTPKDLTDFQAILASRAFDAVAVSFVGSAEDVHRVRELESKSGAELPIVAKIETQLGIENLDTIAEASDALMAARGDLALTMPWEDLPHAVDRICEAAAKHDRPWILATQLAEGLERFEFPTRAEICDLAHWMSRGAYGAMLSFETAWGKRPVEAVHSVRILVDHFRRADQPSGGPSASTMKVES